MNVKTERIAPINAIVYTEIVTEEGLTVRSERIPVPEALVDWNLALHELVGLRIEEEEIFLRV